MRRQAGSGALLALALTGIAIGPVAAETSALPVSVAAAVLHDANGVAVGRATFIDTGSAGVRIVLVATGQVPGLHGLHVHTVGSCVAPAFTSAGAHFNPTNTNHGAHAGDLPDLNVGPSGVGVINTTTTGFTLAAGPLSIFDGDGAALIIHANPDDHVTNPTGNSGARIACGEISRIV